MYIVCVCQLLSLSLRLLVCLFVCVRSMLLIFVVASPVGSRECRVCGINNVLAGEGRNGMGGRMK